MRRRGVVGSAAGLLPFGHLGWGYRSRDEFHDRAAEYLADGVNQGQWVEFVGADSRASLERTLAALPGGADALAGGHAGVCPLVEFFDFDAEGVLNPAESLAIREAAVDDVLAAGFTGFRAVIDATALARTPRMREAVARLEMLLDAKMAVLPVSALCAYDLGELGEVAGELTCLHPLTDRSSAPFRLYATGNSAATGNSGATGGAADACTLACDGELDLAVRGIFDVTVGRMLSATPTPQLFLDVSGVSFADHRALLTLDRRAADAGKRIVLVNSRSIVARLAGMLELGNIRFAAG